ncbi:MAG: ribosome small subunit-dependent GTPase A [Ruminiclostridium sp.]|nr:ribosome small subunit-dependent GTPase A [Ruminiclostridium sp.]
MKTLDGKIIRAVGGIYYTETSEGVLACRARGIFRNRSVSPAAGDNVTVSAEDNAEPQIESIAERKNLLIRPPLANLDMVLLVVSSCEPSPNAYIIDKLISIFESKEIETALIFTKTDMREVKGLAEIYEKAGYRCFFTDPERGADDIRACAEGKTSAMIGNSGVGKSSLMNRIFPELNTETGEISKKLGRGRHTTREVRMYPLGGGGYIADTPGFSTVDIERYGRIPKAELAGCFPEFVPYIGKCRFADCAHLKESGCAVTEAVNAGLIARSRYESYARIYAETAELEKKY